MNGLFLSQQKVLKGASKLSEELAVMINENCSKTEGSVKKRFDALATTAKPLASSFISFSIAVAISARGLPTDSSVKKKLHPKSFAFTVKSSKMV